MALRIDRTGHEGGFFRSGDEIISIDGRAVNDQLDLYFLTSDEGAADFVVRRAGGKTISRRLRFETLERALPEYEEMGFRSCASRCVFCFVDQMPPGMRESLYRKDDDYRWSFLYGNFVTLNDVSDEDLRRIAEYHLSPLYISVHATGRGERRRLFGRPMKRDIAADLRFLADRGIEFNAQIVLVPGMNDGEVLENTVRDLAGLRPSCRTVAVVPVGLTAHREGLESLRRVDRREAREIVRWAGRKRIEQGRNSDGADFIQLSDEFYLIAGVELPPIEVYGDFDQLSNGVGMSRLFLKGLEEKASRLGREKLDGLSLTLVTGLAGAQLFKGYVLPMMKELAPGADLHVVQVENRTFGSPVSVSGLLSGGDILAALEEHPGTGGCVVLPPNTVNHEGVMIDGMTPREISEASGTEVFVPEEDFLEKDIVESCSGGRDR